jgi:hypothetical protein
LSVILTSLGVAGGILLARAVARALRRDTAASDQKNPSEAKTSEPRAAPDLADFPCQLGDVILARAGDEAWLAGALVFRERLPMAVLFIAPDAGGDRAVYARPSPHSSLVWMSPVSPDALVLGREPPSAIELGQERFDRKRRLPFRVERLGTGAPDVGDEVIVAEYDAATGERLLIVVGTSGARAWKGRSLEEGTYDVLPGKGTTE